jgi:hypothetical protein
VVAALCVGGLPTSALAQQGGEAEDPRFGESEDEQSTEQQVTRQQQGTKVISNVTLGVGLATYYGDLDANPNNNIVKHIGLSSIGLRAGVDRLLGQYDQYGVSARLAYEYASGSTKYGYGFSASALSLDFLGEYELPIVQPEFVRVFAGGGPMLVIPGEYRAPNTVNCQDLQGTGCVATDLGTRVRASAVGGVTLLEFIRVGVRVMSDDFFDGYAGFSPDDRQSPDITTFIGINYRFGI